MLQSILQGKTLCSIGGKFTSHVFPGDSITVSIEHENDSGFVYQTKVGDSVVLEGRGKFTDATAKKHKPLDSSNSNDTVKSIMDKISQLPTSTVKDLSNKVSRLP